MDHFCNSKSRAHGDIFGGDFYAGDEDVTRGVSLAAIPSDCDFDSKGHGLMKFGDMDGDFMMGSRGQQQLSPGLLVLPGVQGSVELEVRSPSGREKCFVSSASPKEIAEELCSFFEERCNAVVTPHLQERCLRVELCQKFERVECQVSFFVNRSSPSTAVEWTRLDGDAVLFNGLTAQCASFVRSADKDFEQVTHDSFFKAVDSFDFPSFLAPPVPKWCDSSAPAMWELGDGGDAVLPELDVLPCEEEDLDIYVEMAGGDAEDKREAAVSLRKMMDSDVDKGVVCAVLGKHAELVTGLVRDAHCVLAAPDLAGQLVAEGAVPAAPVVHALLDALGRVGPDVLGLRQVARVLHGVVSQMAPQECAGARDELISVVIKNLVSIQDGATETFCKDAIRAVEVHTAR